MTNTPPTISITALMRGTEDSNARCINHNLMLGAGNFVALESLKQQA